MQCLKLGTLASAALMVAGCESLPTATNAAKVADAIGTITPSRSDTCETRRQIAAQSSRIDTIREGKTVVYKAPQCDAVPTS